MKHNLSTGRSLALLTRSRSSMLRRWQTWKLFSTWPTTRGVPSPGFGFLTPVEGVVWHSFYWRFSGFWWPFPSCLRVGLCSILLLQLDSWCSCCVMLYWKWLPVRSKSELSRMGWSEDAILQAHHSAWQKNVWFLFLFLRASLEPCVEFGWRISTRIGVCTHHSGQWLRYEVCFTPHDILMPMIVSNRICNMVFCSINA